MKKLTLLIVCLIAGMATAAAQSQGDKALGLNLNYASETSFGLGGNSSIISPTMYGSSRNSITISSTIMFPSGIWE